MMQGDFFSTSSTAFELLLEEEDSAVGEIVSSLLVE
jgi:hypothetical protein